MLALNMCAFASLLKWFLLCLFCRKTWCINSCFLVVPFFVFPKFVLNVSSAPVSLHVAWEGKVNAHPVLSLLLSLSSLSLLRSTPVIIAFVTATIIQICLGKLLLYIPQMIYFTHTSPPTHSIAEMLIWPQTMCSDFCNWINSKKIILCQTFCLSWFPLDQSWRYRNQMPTNTHSDLIVFLSSCLSCSLAMKIINGLSSKDMLPRSLVFSL